MVYACVLNSLQTNASGVEMCTIQCNFVLMEICADEQQHYHFERVERYSNTMANLNILEIYENNIVATER